MEKSGGVQALGAWELLHRHSDIAAGLSLGFP